MSEAVLTLLKWCLLALVYLFFFRVLQATWFATMPTVRRDSNTSSETKRSLRRGRKNQNLALADTANRSLVILEPSSMAGTVFAVVGELSIGRAAGCEITLDDTFISQVHSRVSLGDSGVVVEDLGSTNGTYLNRKKVTAPVVVNPGDVIQVGSTIMEMH